MVSNSAVHCLILQKLWHDHWYVYTIRVLEAENDWTTYCIDLIGKNASPIATSSTLCLKCQLYQLDNAERRRPPEVYMSGWVIKSCTKKNHWHMTPTSLKFYRGGGKRCGISRQFSAPVAFEKLCVRCKATSTNRPSSALAEKPRCMV